MPPSPRRSTRGAPPPTKPPPPASTASSSSLSSARQERATRNVTNEQKTGTPRSLSSEDTSEPPRRSQRSQQPKQDDALKDTNDAGEEAVDESEITRCICGFQDYPGVPLSEAFTEAELEDLDCGSLFISCDSCGVWQHAGCVGIAYEDQVPDKYYCEQCRPKRHELHTDSRGQKYSLYSDFNPKKPRKTSMSKHGDKAQKDRESVNSRASADPTPGRRRATTRSKEHDDEEEQLKRAIEESRREVEDGKRSGKRARDESDDTIHIIKRQRRTSELPHKSVVLDDEESSDEQTVGGKTKKTKAESVRQAELRAKEKEREKARAEAAGRRQERAGRRRIDDDPADDTPKPTESNRTSPPQSPQQPPSPPLQDKISHKKGAGKKTKKLGNNQYTSKSRGESEVAASSPQPTQNHNSAGSSGDERIPNGKGNLTNGNGSSNKQSPDRANGNGNGRGKFGKGKHKGMNGNANGGAKEEREPAELTFAVMKRRMEAMASFINKAQAEIAGGDRTPSSDGYARPTPTIEEGMRKLEGGAVKLPTIVRTSDFEEKKLEELTALEMADVLSKRIGDWHTRFDQFV